MKIIILGSAHPLRGGGIATFNERMASVLQEQGHEVIIYSFSLQYPSFLFPGKSQFTDEPAPAGLNIKSVINSINPLNWIIQGNKIKAERADLIIVRFWLPFMGPCLGTILRIVRKNKHTKIVSITDNVIPHEKRFGDEVFTKYFLKPIDAFVAMSKEVLHDLKSFSNKPSVYTPHPLYDNYGASGNKREALEKLGLNPSERHLLFFGFIRKYKGLDWLLEAMNDDRIKAENIKLIVAGEFYGDEEVYTQLIEKFQLHSSVKLFTTFIPNDEVKYYFCAADLVVQPYKTATQSGITQIAYHFEKPMIVTNVGGLAENVPDGKVGYVAEPNPKSIADAIIAFYKPGSIPHLEENIKREKDKYSWENFIQQLLAVAQL
ncbi:MAG: glycosyltransferase [Chitinophagaceae bacterium]|jgi:glycosyltransferase involved in cell wall biosynthesis